MTGLPWLFVQVCSTLFVVITPVGCLVSADTRFIVSTFSHHLFLWCYPIWFNPYLCKSLCQEGCLSVWLLSAEAASIKDCWIDLHAHCNCLIVGQGNCNKVGNLPEKPCSLNAKLVNIMHLYIYIKADEKKAKLFHWKIETLFIIVLRIFVSWMVYPWFTYFFVPFQVSRERSDVKEIWRQLTRMENLLFSSASRE